MDNKEIVRKTLHILLGSFIIFSYYYNLISGFWIFCLLLVSALFSYVQKKHPLPIITYFVKHYGRESEKNFPGKGFVLFLIGALLTVELFQKNIALASLAILTFGDSSSQIFSTLVHKHKFKIHKKKSLTGYLVSMTLSWIISSFFVNFLVALVGVVSAITLELFEVKIEDSVLDDNILVPLTAGTSMLIFLSHFF